MAFNQFEEEYLDFFGDEESYEALRSKVQTVIFARKDECKHVRCFEERGKKFCLECGNSFEVSHDQTMDDACDHINFVDEDGIRTCTGCGHVLKTLNFDAEWRYYGASDTRSTRDPSRCHRSRDTRSRIAKVFEDAKMHVAHAIVARCEAKFQKMSGDETVRGKSYRARVAASYMYVNRQDGIVYSADEVREMFGLNRQDMSEGITLYLAAFPEDRVNHIRPADLTRRILKKAEIDLVHYPQVFKIARCLERTDLMLNHSTPQAVSAAVTYFYLCMYPELKRKTGLTKNRFAAKIGLSEITISKLCKKISEVLVCPVVM